MNDDMNYRIGVLGSGFIVSECHLASYANAGYPVAAIASRTKANALAVADRYGIPTVHDDPLALLDDASIEVLDIAVRNVAKKAHGVSGFVWEQRKATVDVTPLAALSWASARSSMAVAEGFVMVLGGS